MALCYIPARLFSTAVVQASPARCQKSSTTRMAKTSHGYRPTKKLPQIFVLLTWMAIAFLGPSLRFSAGRPHRYAPTTEIAIYIYTQIYSNSTKTWPLVTRSLTFPSPFFSIESDVCSFQCSTAIPFPEIIPGWFTSLSWQLIALPSISNLSTMSLWITRDEQSVDSNDWFDEIWPKSPVTFQCPQWNPWIYMSWLG